METEIDPAFPDFRLIALGKLVQCKHGQRGDCTEARRDTGDTWWGGYRAGNRNGDRVGEKKVDQWTNGANQAARPE